MRLACIFLIFIGSVYLAICSKDTLETNIKTEIVVQSERVRTQKSYTLSNFRIDLKSSTLTNINSLTDILNLFPGIYIRDYGGIGGIKLISHRGLSAPDVAVLLDGTKINNQQNGVLDLTLIPSEAFEEIELIKGGSSTLYGNNSTSGFLNFSFNSFKTKNKVKVSVGEFKQFKLNTHFFYELFKTLKSNFGFSIYKSDGSYSIDVSEFGIRKKVKRENNQITTYSIFLLNTFETESLFSKLNILFTHSNRGVPGAVLQNNIENKIAKLSDDFLFINFRINPVALDSNLEISAKTLFTKSSYFDPQTNLLILGKEKAEYNNNDLEIKILYQKLLFSFMTNLFIETNYASFNGDMLINKKSNLIERKNFATGFWFVRTFNLFTLKYGFETNFRFDAISNFSPMYSISFGFFFKDTLSKLMSKLNLSTNYRLPTFNELYYLNYGSQSLRPEKTNAVNLEIGIEILEHINPTISFFYYLTKDKIISVPKSPVQWSASNIAKTQSLGLELGLTTKINFFEGVISYSFTQATDRTSGSPSFGKQLVYTPKHIANIFVSFPFFTLITLSSRFSYIGERFSLPDNSLSSKLSSYSLLDLFFSKKFNLKKFTLFVNLEILNILDTKYEVILNYPMPGRYFLFTITTSF